MDFYSITLTVAIIMFILLLTLMGVLISRASQSNVYPPTMGTCPDYWFVDASGYCNYPMGTKVNAGFYTNKLVKDIPTTKVPFSKPIGDTWYFDPQDSRWSGLGKTSICAKRDWTIQQNIVWDGVSNYNGC